MRSLLRRGLARGQHAGDRSKLGQHRVGVGLVQQETRITAVAAGGVEDVFAAAHVERVAADHPAGEQLRAR